MNHKFLILFVFLLSAGRCQRLTEKENELIRKTCGTDLKLKSYDRKVLNGAVAKIIDAPWNVAFEVMNGVPGLCSGTLISSRHVITARHCFANLVNGQYKWIVPPEEKVAECKEGQTDIVEERNFSEMFKVFVGVDCGYRKNCGNLNNFTDIGIRRIVFPESCDDKQLDFDDFAIVELAENVEFSRKVWPICVAADDRTLFESDSVTKLFGYGVDPSKGIQSVGRLRYETVEVMACEYVDSKKTFCTKSILGRQMACVGDSGGGVVREVNGRVTLLGAIFQGVDCDGSVGDEQDHIANAAYYSDAICEYAGVCAGERKPKSAEGKQVSNAGTGARIDTVFAHFLILMTLVF